ncbi:MAG TPA: peptidoglycan DD-metalloendopeptidase family protein [Allosphingosinicella sp.]|nr:peptidoglycan DD-metalloendopeptidase family protein [Allosphingosinicella sp.]
MRRALLFLAAFACTAGVAVAQNRPADDHAALRQAQQEANQALARSQRLEQEAAKATTDAARARAEAEALAARIEAGEADITAAEQRVRIAEALAAGRRARLAERQKPVVRLTAALQTMARRPPALALVQPGSLDDVVRVRSVLASTLPRIRAQTASLRAEVAEGNRFRQGAANAHRALLAAREELQRRRIALARFETQQRQRSLSLAQSALVESDRALALGEEARELARRAGTREAQERLGARLADLPGPVPRPNSSATPTRGRAAYMLPVEGRLVTGVGELSDGGVHARGLTIAAAPDAEVVAPADGRIVHAGRFLSYGEVVIIDHGGGLQSVVTDLASLAVAVGQRVRRGERIGRAGSGDPRIGIELRRAGRAVAIAPLLAG